MSKKMKQSFVKEMQNMQAAGLLRQEVAVEESNNMTVVIGEEQKKEVLNFISNDFLGWQNHEAIKEATAKANQDFGSGSTSSRNALGTSKLIQTLEEGLCDFLDVEECMVMPSSYLANIGIFDAIAINRDHIFIDEKTNPGLIDGVRLTNAQVKTYRCCDYENLEYHLKCSESARYRIIASDAAFYANGQLCDLEHLHQLSTRYDAVTVVDDSLGVGLIGNQFRGSYHYHDTDTPDILCGSFAYALGNVGGGFIGGDKALIDWLRQSSRSYLSCEPLAPVNAASVIQAVHILENDQALAEALTTKVRYVKEKLERRRWKLVENELPIISIVIGSTLIVQKMVEILFEKGILLNGLCYPNTEEGEAQLRIQLSAQHSINQLDQLITTLSSVRYLVDDVESSGIRDSILE